MTPAEFIDEKGGPAAMARAIEEACPQLERPINAGSIALWRHRNKIPRANWPEVMDAYPDLTMPDLRAMENAGAAAGEHRPPAQEGAAA
jgi:hypothetical protein